MNSDVPRFSDLVASFAPFFSCFAAAAFDSTSRIVASRVGGERGYARFERPSDSGSVAFDYKGGETKGGGGGSITLFVFFF